MASPMTVRSCRTAAGKTSSPRKTSSDVAAVIASILRGASRISRKKEASYRIDNPSLFENLRAYPCLQSALRHQIDLAPDQSLQLLAQRFELESPNARAGVEFNHDVDIAARLHLPTHRRSKQAEFPDTVVPAEVRQLLFVDLRIAEL